MESKPSYKTTLARVAKLRRAAAGNYDRCHRSAFILRLGAVLDLRGCRDARRGMERLVPCRFLQADAAK